MDFVHEELQRFAPGLPVKLGLDAALDAAAFAVASDGVTARLRAANAPGLLHAAYTLLEHLGCRFEITGPVVPKILKKLPVLAETIHPVVKRRGIRQHLNFPMDVSAYPLYEAQEYIRNLARLRFNHITFHSYPHQWIEADGMLAGAFFYGWRYDLNRDPLLCQHVLRNQQTFCIPEIEPYYDQPQERSRRAVAWLRALMQEAKRVGLTVQFSFEPVQTSLAAGQQMAESILATYPDIDVLEIITRETGGWGQAPTIERLREVAAKFFNLADVAPWLRDGQRDLDGYLADLGANLQLVRQLHGRVRTRLSFGIYCAVPAYLKLSVQEMRRQLPADVEFAILAGHGSRRVAHNLAEAGLTAADWARTLVYSWLEFDGIMYLQQNGTHGLRQLFEIPTVPAGMAFNHWRTAENRIPARFAAQTTLRGPVAEEQFYSEYAADFGIGEPSAFTQAMLDLDEADTLATEGLPNVAFCADGIWRDNLGSLKWQSHPHLRLVLTTYETALQGLRRCVAATCSENGWQRLGFLDNRLQCTILYLKATEQLVVALPLFQKPLAQLTAGERQQIVAACDRAAALFEAYRQLHASAMPDRGCEGTLLSFHTNLPVACKHLRKVWGGVGAEVPIRAVGINEPPLPIFAS